MSVFESKHRERDAEIPMHRQMIKEKIERDLLDDPFIVAVFYGGSIGNNDSDNYSDIDLRIVVAEEEFENYRAKKRKRATRWGAVSFFEDVPYSNYSSAHYENFVKVDTFYYRLKDVLPSFWLRNIEVLFDTSEMLEDVVEKSRKLTFDPSCEDVELWRTKFFSYLHESYRRVMRNEIYYALNCLDNLRFFMTTAWYMEAGIQPNALGDWAKIEGDRSQLEEWQLAKLAEWGSGRNPEDIMNAVINMIPEFKRVHRLLCEKVGLDEDIQWVEGIINKVL